MVRPKQARVLTRRERDIVRGIQLGLSNRDIAASLGINEKTVRNHLTVVYEKLRVSGRLQLALLVARNPRLPREHDGATRDDSDK